MKKIITAVAVLLLALFISGCQDINDITRQRQLESISLDTSSAQTEFIINKKFSSSGLIIYGRYSDNTVDKEPVALASFKGFDSSALTEGQVITVSYKGFSASYTVSVVTSELKSIAVTTKPKLIYNLGDKFDSTGMVVTGYYSDGSTSDVTADCTVVNFESKVSGHKLVSIVYSRSLEKQISAVLDVYVSDKALKGISLTVNKTAYSLGEQLASDDLTVYGSYNDAGTDTAVLTTYEVLGFDTSAVTSNLTVTIKVNDFTESYAISVQESLMTGIQVETLPSKTIYGHGETLDLTGLVVTGIYADGVKHDSGLVGYAVSTLDTTTDDEGVRVLTVTYQWKNNKKFETTFQVAVTAAKMTSISVMDPPASIYRGESINLAGKVIGVYTNNTTCQLSGYSMSGYDHDNDNAVGTHHVVVTYNNTFKFSFDVEVKTEKLTGIEIYTKPSTLVYFQGQSFNWKGLYLKWTYTSGAVISEYNGAGLTFTDISGFKPGVYEVVIAVTENTDIHTSVYIEIKKILSSITLDYSSVPAAIQDDKSYKGVPRGAVLDLSNLKVTAHYTDDSSCVVSGYSYQTEYIPSGSKATSADTDCKVEVTYKESYTNRDDVTATSTFSIRVVKPELEKITVKELPDKTKYINGDSLDVTGMKLTLTYTDGPSDVKYDNNAAKVGKNGEAITVAADSMASGTHICTISAAGISTTMNIQIVPKLTGVRLSPENLSITCPLGTTPDLSSLVVYAIYDDNNPNGIETKDYKVSYVPAFDSNTKYTYEGRVTVTQNDYKNVQAYSARAEFTVTVTNAQLLGIKVKSLNKYEYGYNTESFTANDVNILWKYTTGDSDSPLNNDSLEFPKIKDFNVGYHSCTINVSNHSEITASVGINIVRVLQSLSYNYDGPSSYLLGTYFDSSRLKVTAHYNDGTSSIITGYTLTNDKPFSISGTNSIKISYEEINGGIKTTVNNDKDLLKVIVTDAILTGVSITEYPAKLDYHDTDSFSTKDMKITYTYSDESFTKPQKGETLSCPDFDTSTAGYKPYTFYVVKNDGTKLPLTLTIHMSLPTSLALDTTNVPSEYPLGLLPDLKNLTVNAKYPDGTFLTLKNGNGVSEIGSYSVSTPNFNSVGLAQVIITYCQVTAPVSFDVNIVPPVKQSLKVSTQPSKMLYCTNDRFDPTGMVVDAIYTDGSSEAYTNYKYTWPDGTLCDSTGDKTGDRQVIIKSNENFWGEKTADTSLTIKVGDGAPTPKTLKLYNLTNNEVTQIPAALALNTSSFKVFCPYVRIEYTDGYIYPEYIKDYTCSYNSETKEVILSYVFNSNWHLSRTITVSN